MKSVIVSHLSFDGYLAKAELEAGGERFRLELRSSVMLCEPQFWGDVWLHIALLPAMALNQDLKFSGGTMSSDFEAKIGGLQSQIASWFPQFSPIQIEAPVAGPSPTGPSLTGQNGRACLFTGGVDSSFSLLSYGPEAIVYVIDTYNEPPKISELMRKLVGEVSQEFNVQPLLIESNVRSAVDRYSDWGLHFHGLFFSSIGALLSETFSSLVVPEGNWREMRDTEGWGIHPRLVPLLAGDLKRLEFHGGAVSRFEKIRHISGNPAILSRLRVCWQTTEQLNCSTCEKCLRTMVALEILGVLESAESFREQLDLTSLLDVRLVGPAQISWAKENQLAAWEHGCLELAETLGKVLESSGEAGLA